MQQGRGYDIRTQQSEIHFSQLKFELSKALGKSQLPKGYPLNVNCIDHSIKRDKEKLYIYIGLPYGFGKKGFNHSVKRA